MATRPQNDQTNVIELDAFRGDRAQLEVQEIVHNRTTEITTSEHYAAQAIRVGFGVEPLVYDEPIKQPVTAKVEITASNPEEVAQEHLLDVQEESIPAQLEVATPTESAENEAEVLAFDAKKAREDVEQALQDAGDPAIDLNLPKAA